MEALISVIVPVYNVKEYLRICLDSILRQRYKNMEILLIDDGSTDGSGDLCDEIALRDSRVRVFHKENGGLSDARNFGIDHANGEFYAFIDSDDALHMNFFWEMMNAQKRNNADIVGCGMTLYHSTSELTQLFSLNHSIQELVFSHEEALREYFVPLGQRVIYHGLCMKIYRSQLFDSLRFDKGRLHEDLYITYKLLDKSKSVVYIDCPYYFYFQNNNNSICNNYGVKNFLDEAEAYNRIYNYFRSKDNVTEELIHFLIIQYLFMLEKGYKIRKEREIKDVIIKSKDWIRKHINNCSHFNGMKKIMILMSLKDIRIFTLINNLRGNKFNE